MIINLAFVRGSSIRKVKIDGRVIALISSETGFVPMRFDLDKLEENKNHPLIAKLNEEQKEILEESYKLKGEEELAEDIENDFRREGWRRIKKTWGS